jgi:phosphate-starvation-inducible protein E
VLTVVIAAVILIALYRLIVSVIDVLVLQTRNPLEYPVFQQVFGEILTLLIALEFNDTLQYVVTRERGIIQAKIVILIAMEGRGSSGRLAGRADDSHVLSAGRRRNGQAGGAASDTEAGERLRDPANERRSLTTQLTTLFHERRRPHSGNRCRATL